MADDSGRGGFFVHTFQFLTLTFPLIYFIGLISSISVLYSDLDNKQTLAFWLSSMAGIHLLIIVVFAGTAYLKSNFDQRR